MAPLKEEKRDELLLARARRPCGRPSVRHDPKSAEHTDPQRRGRSHKGRW
jgi:hypothetical protein